MSITFSGRNGDEFVSEEFDVNMSNFNAYSVMRAMGIMDGCCGSMPSSEFGPAARRAIVRIVNGNMADDARPSTIDGRVITCERPEGYVEGRLRQLAELADNSTEVCWG